MTGKNINETIHIDRITKEGYEKVKERLELLAVENEDIKQYRAIPTPEQSILEFKYQTIPIKIIHDEEFESVDIMCGKKTRKDVAGLIKIISEYQLE